MASMTDAQVKDVQAGRSPALGRVVMVGRPNVGKSTLFNRLTRSRAALVSRVPGTTRDWREGEVQQSGCRFVLVDTGGRGGEGEVAYAREIDRQIEQAAAGADFIWLVLDGAEGPTPFDETLARWLQRQGRPYCAVVNKVDSQARLDGLAEFYALGLDPLVPLSAEHNRGLDDLLEASAELLPALLEEETAGEEAAPQPVRVAFVGRPNVGKSSLVNRALGEARMIVSESAGTTREAVELPFRLYGQDYVLVDTAGIRRRARTTEYLDKLSALNAIGAMDRVDVAVLVLDAGEPIANQDQRIAGYILEHRRAVVVAMNKWDRLGGRSSVREVEADLRHGLRFLEFAPFVRTSAVEGTGLETLFGAIGQAAEQFGRQLRTADLNRVVQAVGGQQPPPAKGGSPTRIYYGSQIRTRPPLFRFFSNHPERFDAAYTRYMENQLRYHFGLRGTPIGIEWRGRSGERGMRGGSSRA